MLKILLFFSLIIYMQCFEHIAYFIKSFFITFSHIYGTEKYLYEFLILSFILNIKLTMNKNTIKILTKRFCWLRSKFLLVYFSLFWYQQPRFLNIEKYVTAPLMTKSAH